MDRTHREPKPPVVKFGPVNRTTKGQYGYARVDVEMDGIGSGFLYRRGSEYGLQEWALGSELRAWLCEPHPDSTYYLKDAKTVVRHLAFKAKRKLGTMPESWPEETK